MIILFINLNILHQKVTRWLDIFVFQLIDTDRYRSIDKIRSSGQSYMIAVGLLPEIGTNVFIIYII